jgi:hypothetical protein
MLDSTAVGYRTTLTSAIRRSSWRVAMRRNIPFKQPGGMADLLGRFAKASELNSELPS